MEQYIIRTKLSIPQHSETFISRQSLIKRLSEGVLSNRRLTLVSAPPGYGKTSLIAEWSLKSAVGFLWLSLDHGDNEPVRFFSYFITALQKAEKSAGVAALSLLDAPQLPPSDMLAGVLINDIADLNKKIVFVLDDFQYINNETIINMLKQLMENQPDNLHIVIITRQDPVFSLSRLRARGLLTEIRAEDLRFTCEETVGFIRAATNMQLDGEQIKILESRTEGWAAGLQLAALSMQGRDREALAVFFNSFGGTQKYILDYLFDEVFGQLSGELREFLVETSILERLCGPLCDELLGRQDSMALIGRILKANLFLLSLGDDHWFRYHTLFRDILLTELDEGRKKVLHIKASEWFEKNGYYEDAVSHALAAGEFDLLDRLLRKIAWMMIQNGRFKTLLSWIQILPAEKIDNNSELKMVLAWCLLLTGCGREASRLMNTIDLTELVRYRPEIIANMLVLQIFKSVSFKELAPLKISEQAAEFAESSDPVLRTAALYCMAQAMSFRGLLDESVRSYQEAYRSALTAGQYFMAIIAAKNMAITQLLRGKKKEVLRICSEAMEQLVDPKGKLLPAAFVLYVPLGMAYYSEDRLDKAGECLEEGISVCRKLSLTHFSVQGEMSLALLQFALRDTEAAFETIRNACRSLEEIGMTIGIPVFEAIEAELHLRSGNLEFARKWADEIGLDSSSMVGMLDERLYFTYSRILMAEERYEEADSILDKLELFSEQGGRVYRLITLYILRAVNYSKMNKQAEALDALRTAVRLAAPESYFRLFIDEDPCISVLLTDVRTLAPEFIDKLSEKYRSLLADENRATGSKKAGTAKSIPGGKRPQGLIEPLSEREVEVLKLVADGLQNSEIAEKLFISLGTTKWHITNIFSKLGVKNRVQAAEAAKTLFGG